MCQNRTLYALERYVLSGSFIVSDVFVCVQIHVWLPTGTTKLEAQIRLRRCRHFRGKLVRLIASPMMSVLRGTSVRPGTRHCRTRVYSVVASPVSRCRRYHITLASIASAIFAVGLSVLFSGSFPCVELLD